MEKVKTANFGGIFLPRKRNRLGKIEAKREKQEKK